MSGFEKLIGKTITGYQLSNNRETLAIETDQGEHVYDVEGDCCSHSWFESVDELDGVIGGKVLEAYTVNMDEIESQEDTLRKLAQEESRDEHIQQYGHKIKTTKGHAIVEFRNSSNGHYGGYMTERYSG